MFATETQVVNYDYNPFKFATDHFQVWWPINNSEEFSDKWIMKMNDFFKHSIKVYSTAIKGMNLQPNFDF